MSELERIENVISDHAISIGIMTKVVSSIESLLVQQTASIKEIEKAMRSQELLMEKLAHLDNRITDSVNRVHKRVDKTELDIMSMKLEHTTACDLIKPMAAKGASVHSGVIKVAQILGGLIITMLFGIVVWAIKMGGAN